MSSVTYPEGFNPAHRWDASWNTYSDAEPTETERAWANRQKLASFLQAGSKQLDERLRSIYVALSTGDMEQVGQKVRGGCLKAH